LYIWEGGLAMPVSKKVGDEVIGATINKTGSFKGMIARDRVLTFLNIRAVFSQQPRK
jgi:cation transport ATPase